MSKNKDKIESENKELLSEYEIDSMWMSYRYCIGRHTIASHCRAGDIAKHCYGRLTPERSVFTAYDMNRSVEDSMRFSLTTNWHFPTTSYNEIYTTAIDIFCEFLEDYDIKSKEDFLKYCDIHIILTDNERGYKFEVTTWREEIEKHLPKFKQLYKTVETVDDVIELIRRLRKMSTDDIDSEIRYIVRNYPDPEYFYFHDYEDLFVWNDLIHLFDLDHHYWVELTDGTIKEVFDTWKEKTELREDGYYYKAFGYEKIIVPVDSWNGSNIVWIPKENIKRIVDGPEKK